MDPESVKTLSEILLDYVYYVGEDMMDHNSREAKSKGDAAVAFLKEFRKIHPELSTKQFDDTIEQYEIWSKIYKEREGK